MGVILYEMLVGYPPFFSDDPSVTCQKIVHWKKTLIVPGDANLSPAATDLIKRLVCDAERRLGSHGAREIQAHPFFEGLNWTGLRALPAPFTPELASEVDTANFDKFEEDKAEPLCPVEPKASRRIVLSLSQSDR